MKQRLNHNRKQRGNNHKISFSSYLCLTFTFFTPRQKHAKNKKVKVNPQKLLFQSLTDANGKQEISFPIKSSRKKWKSSNKGFVHFVLVFGFLVQPGTKWIK